MSDEIDPQLLRSFANAHEPLADTQFHESVMNHLQRARKSRGLAAAAGSATLTLLSGLATAVRAPFRLRIGVTGVLTIVFGAIVSLLALLTA